MERSEQFEKEFKEKLTKITSRGLNEKDFVFYRALNNTFESSEKKDLGFKIENIQRHSSFIKDKFQSFEGIPVVSDSSGELYFNSEVASGAAYYLLDFSDINNYKSIEVKNKN